MKRYTIEHVRSVADAFANSLIAQSWYMFGSPVRRALIDSAVMDAMRVADTVDSAIAITPSQLVEFRETLETILAQGIPRRGAPPRCFVVVDD